MPIILVFLVFPSILSVKQPEVCFPSVVRHRIDSVFPTSRLFCVSKQNDELRYDDVQIVQNDEKWNEYSPQESLNEVDNSPDLLTFRSPSGIRLFKLPAAVSESDFCTGTQNVETRRNLRVHCKPLATSDLLSQCTENNFLSALVLFGNGEFVERRGNETVELPRIAPEQLRAPVWNGSMCVGVVKSALLIFHLNGSRTEAAEVRVQYDILPGNVDNNWFEQTFSVRWIHLKEKSDEVKNTTDVGVGYIAGEQIYRMQNSVPIPFAVPTLGHCYSGDIPPSPVLFLRSITSVCTIPTVNCEDARAKAKLFYDQVYPVDLVSSPSGDSHPARVGRTNVTWEQMSPSVSTCRLPVSSLIQVFYSKQGSTKNFREVIVAGNVQLLLDDIPYLPGNPIRMPIRISFTDVTLPPRSIFEALPYIDIRLPHDFFYPFVSTSSASRARIMLGVIFLCIFFNIK